MVVGLAIIAGLLAFADLAKLASLLTAPRPIYLGVAAILIIGYSGTQLVQRLYLLDPIVLAGVAGLAFRELLGRVGRAR